MTNVQPHRSLSRFRRTSQPSATELSSTDVEYIEEDEAAPEPEPEPPPRQSAVGSMFAWLLLVLVAVAFAGFVITIYFPEREESHGVRAQLVDRGDELERRAEELEQQDTKLTAVTKDRAMLQAQLDELQRDTQELRADLERKDTEVAAKDAALDAAQRKLKEALGEEIAAGEIAISRRGSELVVHMEHKILFTPGAAALNVHGRRVLKQLADTIKANPKRVFQVAGHTDADPVSERLAERYPTNWELSTSRATNVVRYLADNEGVPGQQLVAAGYGEFRPIRTNANKHGKRRNRRIEVVMLTRPLSD